MGVLLGFFSGAKVGDLLFLPDPMHVVNPASAGPGELGLVGLHQNPALEDALLDVAAQRQPPSDLRVVGRWLARGMGAITSCRLTANLVNTRQTLADRADVV